VIDRHVRHPTVEEELADAQAAIPRFTPAEAQAAVADGAILVDIRPLARRDVPVILICNEGYQTSFAALGLRRFGVDAGDVIGGVQAWKKEGLPLSSSAQRAADAAPTRIG